MNDDNKIKQGLEEIIRRTFEVIDNVYSVNKDKKNYNSRLIFPKYRNKNNIRVSEQELRFVFVDQFICTSNYSVFRALRVHNQLISNTITTPYKFLLSPFC